MLSALPRNIQDIEVLYRSDNYIVVGKPWDIRINSDEVDDITVATLLAAQFPHLADSSVSFSFRFVHRLDFSTSGALCIALNKKACRAAAQEFEKRRVSKEYLALVRGHINSDHLELDKSIYANPGEGFTHMMCVDNGDAPKGVKVQKALTELTILQRGMYDGEPATKVILTPFTGRRHQLRVHCLDIGHPVVGDYTYSNKQDVTPYRMMLHSHKLRISLKDETIDVTTADPFTAELDKKWIPVSDDGSNS